jgi:hypothetical protein
LRGAERVRTDAVRRNLKTILEEGDAPADEHDFPENFISVFEVAIPRERHEDVRDCEEKNSDHGRWRKVKR